MTRSPLTVWTYADEPDTQSFAYMKALGKAHQARVAVLNLSLTHPRQPIAEDLIRRIVEAGIVVVAAAGNRPNPADRSPTYPAHHPGVIGVGSVGVATPGGNPRYPIATDSAHGPHVDLVAPGADVAAPSPDSAASADRLVRVSGTSFACAHVAATAALLLSNYPTLGKFPLKTANKVREIITASAAAPYRQDPMAYGAGLLRVDEALGKAGETINEEGA